MPDDVYQALLDRLRGFVPKLFGVPSDRLEPIELLVGEILTWPVSGTPGVGEWFTAVVFLGEGTATIEHCYCTEGYSRSDDVRRYGPFAFADPRVARSDRGLPPADRSAAHLLAKFGMAARVSCGTAIGLGRPKPGSDTPDTRHPRARVQDRLPAPDPAGER
jgi:hypothetical protein